MSAKEQKGVVYFNIDKNAMPMKVNKKPTCTSIVNDRPCENIVIDDGPCINHHHQSSDHDEQTTKPGIYLLLPKNRIKFRF